MLTGADRHLLEAPVVEVAPLLLGAVLTRTSPEGSVAVRLTEVEAYAGVGEDPGSHAHRGRTPRTGVMFGEAGHLYAYFSYGLHVCANVVCAPPGRAAAVLLRGGEVVAGEALATARRGGVPPVRLARGPANLAAALGIALAETGTDLLDDQAFALRLPDVPAAVVRRGPRVGVSGAGGSEEYPWRFWLPDEPTVSAYRPGRGGAR